MNYHLPVWSSRISCYPSADLTVPNGAQHGKPVHLPRSQLEASSRLEQRAESHPSYKIAPCVSSVDSLLATSTSASFRSECSKSRCVMHLI